MMGKQGVMSGLAIILLVAITPFVNASANTFNYNYDDVLRLTGVQHGSDGSITYSYDILGNRLSKTTSTQSSPTNNPPNIPTSPSPSDASTNISTTPTLTWAGGDPDSGNMVTYDIYLGPTSPPVLYRTGLSTPSFAPEMLNSMATYYWKIVAKDNFNATTESAEWSFNTTNDAPSTPSNIMPQNSSSIVKENVQLSWSASADPNPDDSVSYDIYFGTSSNPPLDQSAIPSGASYSFANPLSVNTTYYWKIAAKDNHGATADSPVWSFSTLDHDPVVLSDVTYSVNTTLTKADGPYIIQGYVTVSSGVTLTIEPGTIIKIGTLGYISVNGTLIAQGTATDPIIFTSSKDDFYGGDTNGDGTASSPAPGNWKFIQFLVGSDASVLSHAKVFYGGSNYGQISTVGSSPTVGNLEILFSGMHGIHIDGNAPIITGSIISRNGDAGIYVNSGTPTINGNMITDNGEHGVRIISGTVTTTDNVFSGNVDYDLVYNNGSGGTIIGNQIDHGVKVTDNIVSSITGNTIAYDDYYPVIVHADLVGQVINDNTISNINTNSYLEVAIGTITKDAIWTSLIRYHVSGDITIQGTDGVDSLTTLTIDPGSVLLFGVNTSLEVGDDTGDPGALSAQGTADDPILFSAINLSSAQGGWDGIKFYATTGDTATVLSHCVVEYGGNTGQGYSNIYIQNASPVIQNSIIRHGFNSGIYVYSGDPTIDNNVLQDNGTYGLLALSSAADITGNIFSGNVDYDIYSGGTLSGSISNNTFYNGIYLPNSHSTSITQNTITYNNDFPVSVHLNQVGPVAADNTFANLDSESMLEVNGSDLLIDATWPNVIPYRILGSITVKGTDGADGVTTLTLLPGAILKFDTCKSLIVWSTSGELVAQGTAAEPIRFTSSQVNPLPGDWSGIRFGSTTNAENPNNNSILEHCIIEYAGCDNSGAIYVYNEDPMLRNITFNNNSYYGVFVSGYADPVIENCFFSSSGTYDIYFYSTAAASSITGNTITNGIYLYGGSITAITSNTIYYNDNYPLRINAANVGEFLAQNIIENVGASSFLEITGGTVSKDSTWTDLFTYHILETIDINGTEGADNITRLTIDPGVELRFNSGASLKVAYNGTAGALLAQGTAASPIIFTANSDSPSPGYWSGIYIYDAADDANCIISHSIVEYGGHSNYGAIMANYSAPTIENVSISYSAGHGVYFYSIASNTPILRNSTISNNTKTGVHSHYNGTPIIENNTISDNGNYGIYKYTSWRRRGSATITGNTLSGNGNYDILLESYVGGSVTGNTVTQGINASSTGITDLASNTIAYNNNYPLKVRAGLVGGLFSSNTITGHDSVSVVKVARDTIITDATWTNDIIYQVSDNITIEGNDGPDGVTTLTIEPGTRLTFDTAKYLRVGDGSGPLSALVAQGTEANPIVFTSSQATPSPGDWGYIQFSNNTHDASTILEHCIIEYGGQGSGMVTIKSSKPTITNCTIHNSSTSGIYVKYSSPTISNSKLFDNASYGLYRYPSGTYTPIAQNNWWGHPTGPYDPSDADDTVDLYNPNGQGDSVTDYVDYQPWLTVGDDIDGDGIDDTFETTTFGNLITVEANTDFDGDSMTDGWEYLNGLDLQADDTLSDADGDGFSNCREFLADTDPNDSNSIPANDTVYVNVANTGSENGSAGSPFNTIQEGILFAGPGDTIFIEQGTYTENVSVAKDVLLVGEEPNMTIIDGSGSRSPALECTQTTSASVEKLHIKNGSGSGINLSQATATVSKCIVSDTNTGPGALVGSGSVLTIENSIIYANDTDGINTAASDATLTAVNNTIVDNTGDGIDCASGDNVTIKNNIIVSNGDYGINCNKTPAPQVSYNNVWGNTDGGYSGCSAGTGDIGSDPDFDNPTGRDYHLTSTSPCIDAGTSDGAPTDDIDSITRCDDPLVTNTGGGTSPYFDMGACEYDVSCP